LEHRIGGLEKQAITGNVSYDPDNHHAMTMLRLEKVARIARDIPELEVSGPDRGKLLIVSWGSTFGSVNAGIEAAREQGLEVSSIHLRHLNPFPPNLGEILKRFEKILVPELNAGQLVRMLRAEFLVPAIGFSKIKGRPFQIEEIRARIESLLEQKA
jgi:2-oxoglutarate ferredoxin oxidoreductase subunit alpha